MSETMLHIASFLVADKPLSEVFFCFSQSLKNKRVEKDAKMVRELTDTLNSLVGNDLLQASASDSSIVQNANIAVNETANETKKMANSLKSFWRW